MHGFLSKFQAIPAKMWLCEILYWANKYAWQIWIFTLLIFTHMYIYIYGETIAFDEVSKFWEQSFAIVGSQGIPDWNIDISQCTNEMNEHNYPIKILLFLDTQVSLAPTHVSWLVSWLVGPLVTLSDFRSLVSNGRSKKKSSKNKVHLFSNFVSGRTLLTHENVYEGLNARKCIWRLKCSKMYMKA